MNSFSENLRVYWALLRRDLYVIKKRLRTIWTDTAVILFLEVILFGKLIPLMGLPTTMVAPIFLGAIISQTFFKASGKSYQAAGDLRFSRFIDYHLTLPISKTWLFAQIITSWLVEILVGILPFIIFGIIALGNFFPVTQLAWVQGLAFFTLSACMITIFTLACTYYYDYTWFINNIWPRRFGFLYGFCPFYFLWKQAYQFSPRVAQILLLNPFTYCVEGFRGMFLGGSQFISLYICTGMVLLFILCFSLFLAAGVKKRLDPV